MSNNIIGVPTTADAAMLSVGIRGLDTPIESINIPVRASGPRTSYITATYGASILLAKGGAPLEGLTTLRVKNLGKVMARIGEQSGSKYFEEGIELEPGQSIIYRVEQGTPAPKIYARSSGFSTLLEVQEA